MQLGMPRCKFLHQVADRLLRGEVGEQQLDRVVATLCLHLSTSRFAAAQVPTHHHHSGSHLCQRTGDLFPHSCICSGHHRDLALQGGTCLIVSIDHGSSPYCSLRSLSLTSLCRLNLDRGSVVFLRSSTTGNPRQSHPYV